MKTVCPHCHQKYDVPDDYLQQEVSCEKCQQDFVVTKAKFCSECGTPNPAQGFECWKCGTKFQLKAPQSALAPPPVVNPPEASALPNQEEESSSVLDGVRDWYKRELKALGLIYMFLGPVVGMIGILTVESYVIGTVLVICIAVNYQAGVMMRQCVNPKCVLCWTWFEKAIVALFALIFISSLWDIVFNNGPFIIKALMMAFSIYVCHCIYIGFYIYKARLEEQARLPKEAETISALQPRPSLISSLQQLLSKKTEAPKGKWLIVKWLILALVVIEVIVIFIHFAQKSVDSETGIQRVYCCPICPICLTAGNK